MCAGGKIEKKLYLPRSPNHKNKVSLVKCTATLDREQEWYEGRNTSKCSVCNKKLIDFLKYGRRYQTNVERYSHILFQSPLRIVFSFFSYFLPSTYRVLRNSPPNKQRRAIVFIRLRMEQRAKTQPNNKIPERPLEMGKLSPIF